MKHSIRTRITLIFVGLTALMVIAIGIVNACLLEPYYTDQKVRTMETAYENINAAVMQRVNAGESLGDVISQEMNREWEIFSGRTKYRSEEMENSLIGTLRRYSEQNNITLILIDSETGKPMLNFGRDGDFLAQKLQRYILGQSNDSRTEMVAEHENYRIEKNTEFRSGSQYLECWGYFSDNNTLFLMRMPLASIRESVSLTNRFLTVTGLIVLVLGGIIMYFVTRRVTDPLLKLAALSERMSQLDFSAVYEGAEEDEIGILGRSMNSMSERLKETISELQEANMQLQKDIQEKIEIDDMRKEFIANVSHELKTPIALIQGYAEGLTEGMADDAESRGYYCEVIMDEAGKMNRMVRQLLTLTALEFGNDTPGMEVFDICELIRDFVSSASILSEQKDAHVVIDCPPVILVKADEFKIEEVLTNYYNNAMNHLDGERKIRITAERRDSCARVAVFNTGSHIPEESIPNLWTKFYKVDKARTRAYGGTGIGLSIVRAIMDAHHQSCGVKNTEGGVEFWFTLQLAPEEPEIHQ